MAVSEHGGRRWASINGGLGPVLLERELDMDMKNITSCGLVAAAMLWIALTQPNSAKAQSLMGFRVGDTPSKLSKLGPVSGEDTYKGMDVFKWILPDRNVLSATVDREGEIVYVKSDWGGKS